MNEEETECDSINSEEKINKWNGQNQ